MRATTIHIDPDAAGRGPIDPDVADAIRDHGSRFSPIYGGYLSDHGPMAALAWHALGASTADTLSYLRGYQSHLQPITEAPDGYLSLREQILEEITRSTMAEVLAHRLPGLISGWARAAYHPLIRTAYGFDSGIAEEVAAGLAYFSLYGPDEAIGSKARGTGESIENADAAFAMMRGGATQVSAERNFNDCLTDVVASDAFGRAQAGVADPLRAFSHSALSIFTTTHNFFALHLVTGAHAFRILQPFVGGFGDRIFALGLMAGYAAAGAPDYRSRSPVEASGQAGLRQLTLDSTDEHDIKLTHSCICQATYFGDQGYIDAATAYLSR